MKHSSKIYAIHILECIAKIELYTDANKELFLNDEKTYDAVIRNLQTLAEAAGHIDPNIQQKHPEIEWRQITGFHNILVHNYLGSLDPTMLWDVIIIHLPLLKAILLEEYGAIHTNPGKKNT